MPITDTLWFTPLAGGEGALQPVYQAVASEEVAAGEPFTLRLEAVKLAQEPLQPIWDRILHPDHDVLVLSKSALGGKPLVERVHFFKQSFNVSQPLRVHDLLSDTILVCDDYNGHDNLDLEVQVVTIDTSSKDRDAVFKSFTTLLGTTGSIFPVALPYAAVGAQVLSGLEKLLDATGGRDAARIAEPIKLFPPQTERAKTIRKGRYVVFSAEVDGTGYRLLDDGQVDGPAAEVLSYLVLRIETAKELSLDFVISQRVATLLTQLKNDDADQPAGALETSLGFLTDTLRAYTSFTDLQRYAELSSKPNRTPQEDEQLKRLGQRPDLQPFLPKPQP
jgi:hypothetical protein